MGVTGASGSGHTGQAFSTQSRPRTEKDGCGGPSKQGRAGCGLLGSAELEAQFPRTYGDERVHSSGAQVQIVL